MSPGTGLSGLLFSARKQIFSKDHISTILMYTEDRTGVPAKNMASDLDLHCLLMSNKNDTRLLYGIRNHCNCLEEISHSYKQMHWPTSPDTTRLHSTNTIVAVKVLNGISFLA